MGGGGDGRGGDVRADGQVGLVRLFVGVVAEPFWGEKLEWAQHAVFSLQRFDGLLLVGSFEVERS